MQTDTYNSPFNARYASKEMQYIYSRILSSKPGGSCGSLWQKRSTSWG